MYRIVESRLHACAEIEKDWQALCLRAEHSFFMSWEWVSVWFETYQPKAQVLRVFLGEELVAISLLVPSHRTHLKIFGSSCLNLSLTGIERQDQVWPEYNHILVDRTHTDAAIAAVGAYFRNMHWDELVVGAVTSKFKEDLSEALQMEAHTLWESKSFGVDLEGLRAKSLSFLDSLSRNTRYQIRRSIKAYESESGPIELLRAGSSEEALAFFNDAGPLHIAKWGTDLSGSGYVNPEFIAFHQKLIAKYYDTGHIDIFALTVGGEAKCYLYNFKYQNQALFYLGSMVSESDAKLKPGLIAHSLCIQLYVESGLDYYDFMAGEHRYKISLGEESETQFWLAYQRNKPVFKLESTLRKIKNMFVVQNPV